MRNVLYISMATPFENVPHAGGKTFYYYIKGVQDDDRFQVCLISKLLDVDNVDDINLNNVKKHFVKNQKLSFLHPVQTLKDLNAKYNPIYKYGNVLRNSIFKGISKEITSLKFCPDVVVLEFTCMLLMVDMVKQLFPDAKIIASEHDVSFLGYERKYRTENNFIKKAYFRIQYINIKKRELRAIQVCDIVMPHCCKDKKLLIKNGINEKKIHVLTPFFEARKIIRNPDYKTVLFYGAMNRLENEEAAIWFIENVMQKTKDINFQFVILGAYPSDKLKTYASDRVSIIGFVEDISQYMSNCTCAVAPLLHGAGIKVKILEFMAMGVPVITNSIGIEGISAIENRDYIHCESQNEYITAIRNIFTKSINLDTFHKNSIDFINTNFDLHKSLVQYKNLLSQ